jgi:M6 family metalloprotease-like protein
VSYGAVAMAFDLYGPVTVPEGTTACAWSTWLAAAVSAANVDTSKYTNVMGVGTGDGCTFGGVARLSNATSYLNNNVRWSTMAHELGHNYRLPHASFFRCTSGGVNVTFSSSCSSVDFTYADRYDRMGSGNPRHFSSYNRWRLGYGTTRTDITTDRTLTIGVASVEGASNQLVVIPRGPDGVYPDGAFFVLEYRQPFGAYDWFGNSTEMGHKGVLIRFVHFEASGQRTYLLDMSPATSLYYDPALLPGKTFTDSLTGIRITTNSVSSSGASVTIDVP